MVLVLIFKKALPILPRGREGYPACTSGTMMDKNETTFERGEAMDLKEVMEALTAYVRPKAYLVAYKLLSSDDGLNQKNA